MIIKERHQRILNCVERIYRKAKKGFLNEPTIKDWLTELQSLVDDPVLGIDPYKNYQKIKVITSECFIDGPVTVDDFQRPLLRLEYYSRRELFGEDDERVKEVGLLLSRQRHDRKNVFMEVRM